MLRWFDELGDADSGTVGAKMARLGTIRRLGLDVPDGFAVTVDAFRHFLAHDGLSDALGSGLQVAVADMGISQGHPGVGVPEHASDGGQGNAPGYGLAGDGMPEIVQADVVEPGFLSRPGPETQGVRERLVRVSGRWKHVWACGARLAGVAWSPRNQARTSSRVISPMGLPAKKGRIWRRR